MKKISIIFPVLNEIDEVKTFKILIEKFHEHQIIFCDGGSTDGTPEALRELQAIYPSIVLCFEKLVSPSVLKTIELAYPQITQEFTLIHPIDLDILHLLEDLNINAPCEALVFHKRYQPDNQILKLQAIYLNRIDLNLRQNFVWTNAPIIKSDILKRFTPKVYGFLEDVQLSDWLKNKVNLKVIEKPIIVSSRRYIQKGTLKRFIKNAFIMLAYRLKLVSIEKLKSIYYS